MSDDTTSRLPLTWRANPAGLGLLVTTAALLAIGVIMVHSVFANLNVKADWFKRSEIKHTIFAAVALLVLCTAWRLDYHRLAGRRPVPVFLGVLLLLALATVPLVYVPGLGLGVGGRKRWVKLGDSVQFQPSELVLLAMVLFLSAWLTRDGSDLRMRRAKYWAALAIIVGCVGAVIREDFGTAMLIGVAGVVTLFLAGGNLLTPVFFAVLAAVAFRLFVAGDPKRAGRIGAFADPWDPNNPAAYQIQQSLLAVMSGGMYGKGVGRGMLKRGFLPESSSDFIFSVFCEEWGMIGGLFLVALLLVWMWHARRSALRADSNFGRVLAAALGFTIALQAVIHMAVDLVTVPPKGIGMPFVSLGGTKLVVMAAAVAMMISVSAHRRADGAGDGGEMLKPEL
jgi:cell division protein FtsW